LKGPRARVWALQLSGSPDFCAARICEAFNLWGCLCGTPTGNALRWSLRLLWSEIQGTRRIRAGVSLLTRAWGESNCSNSDAWRLEGTLKAHCAQSSWIAGSSVYWMPLLMSMDALRRALPDGWLALTRSYPQMLKWDQGQKWDLETKCRSMLSVLMRCSTSALLLSKPFAFQKTKLRLICRTCCWGWKQQAGSCERTSSPSFSRSCLQIGWS